MYKIIAAINSMISNQQLITGVIKRGNRLYFVYDVKFKWAITKTNDGEFILYYFHSVGSLEDIFSVLEIPDGEELINYITYSTKELKTQEAIESFSELYQTIQGKLYGIDEVLDSIINTAA